MLKGKRVGDNFTKCDCLFVIPLEVTRTPLICLGSTRATSSIFGNVNIFFMEADFILEVELTVFKDAQDLSNLADKSASISPFF